MSIGEIFKKVYHYIEHIDMGFVSPSMSAQMEFLSKQEVPQNDAERGFLQYKCQMRLMPPVKRIIQQIAAAIMFWPYTVMILFRRKSFARQCDAVFLQNGMGTSIIPQTVLNEFKDIQISAFTDDACLGLNELTILLKLIMRHPFSYFFHIKVCMKLALYNAQIIRYNPRTIITYCETSYASAIATKYLEDRGLEHINVMHGDFLKSIRFCGFRFSRFYVWDEHFKTMFTSLGNDTTPYIAEMPESLTMACRKPEADEVFEYYLTYYLGNENDDGLRRIKEAVDKLTERGHRCKIRIHPRETVLKKAEQIFGEDMLELPSRVSLKESMESSEYLCALCSTVLYQGYMCGKKIIIDDISNPEEFERLKEKEYIMLSRRTFALSELIEEMVK